MIGDADPNSQTGYTAQGATQEFVAEFKAQLEASLGEAGAKQFLEAMGAAGGRLLKQNSSELGQKDVTDYINSVRTTDKRYNCNSIAAKPFT
jgi:hypothetical protein